MGRPQHYTCKGRVFHYCYCHTRPLLASREGERPASSSGELVLLPRDVREGLGAVVLTGATVARIFVAKVVGVLANVAASIWALQLLDQTREGPGLGYVLPVEVS